MSALRRAVRAAASSLEALPDDRGWQRQYCFTKDSAVFEGHFPGHPVLPAVVQVLMAQTTLEDGGQPAVLARVPQAKFLTPLTPGLVIELSVLKGRRQGVWDCSLHNAGTLAARFQLETTAS